MALIGHWALDDDAASTTVTATVGSNGTASRNTSNLYIGDGNGPGATLLNAGFDFDDTIGDYVENLGNIANVSAATVCCWVKSSDATADTMIYFDDRDAGGSGLMLGRSFTQGTVWIFEPQRADQTGTIHDGTWHFVSGTYNGTTLRLMVDLVEQDTASLSSASTDNNNQATIGCRSFNRPAAEMSGFLADVRIYDSALDDTALTAVRNAAKPTFSVAATISGNNTQGAAKEVAFTVDDTTTITYQWYRADDSGGTGEAAISGATSSIYNSTASDLTKYLSCAVTSESNAGLTTTSQSAYDGPITASSGLPIPAAYYYNLQMALS